MKQLLAVFTLVILSSCQAEFDGDLSPLQGYWQIEEVTANGQLIKAYQTNLVVDYFELQNDTAGLRKKLAPKLDGTYASTKNSERFVLIDSAKTYYLQYSTPYAKWQEKIISITPEQLILEDTAGTRYQYKPHQANNILINY
ncbi:hypothetical protein BTO09_01345 [Gilvibacter sp. SZ-19]|uniref:lipocalin family protein n=1 Tax=Gilvibacter sp. SZ-19 TaxID=754429 RepID=UPI000B3C9CBD|nr:lipocalin family protein [Gilvibacter sp. SZ-19]ARV11066.1 hypothetical protein BTO09_01345 [Gilvibacter sp. SZ-19]